ncbi:hypothetical protein V2J09_019871 [Rumex salicifolius]
MPWRNPLVKFILSLIHPPYQMNLKRCVLTVSKKWGWVCECVQVKPMYGMEESVSFGRFTSESLSWEKWSTFNRNRYVEEAEKYSRPGSVKQKKAFLEAHFKKMTTLSDAPAASPDHSNLIQQAPTQPNVDDTAVANDHNELPSEQLILDQQWIDKEDFGANQNEDKGEVLLSSIDVVGLDQFTDVMDAEKQNPITETENGLTNAQEFGLQSSSIIQENPAPELIKKTPLSSYIPSVEAGSSLISSSAQEGSGVQSPAAAHPLKEMGKKRSPLYKFINSKLIKKIGLSSKASKSSRLKTSLKDEAEC